MAAIHPETELVPYLRNELSGDERRLVEEHLDQCAQCRESAMSLRLLINCHSSRQRLKLCRRPIGWRIAPICDANYLPPVPNLLTREDAATVHVPIASFRLALVGDGASGGCNARDHPGHASRLRFQTPGVDQLEQQTDIGSADVGLLANYRVVEHLDLLENYDVIEHLDELAPGDRQNHEASS